MVSKKEKELEAALLKIREIMLIPAGNRKFMQIARPAREVLNIIKKTIP